MSFRRSTLLRLLLSAVLLLSAGLMSYAQMKPGQVDIFAGIDFNYRDMLFNGRVIDVNVNLAPGVKWNLGHRWEIAAQALVPLINQFGPEYSHVRLNIASLSKQLAVGDRFKMKLSGGVFTWNRYGIDAKGMFIANKWLAFTGQIGCTGLLVTSPDWQWSTMKRITFTAGPRFWLNKWTTEFSARGGRFVYGDYGVVAEVMRHFRHVTVGAYGMYGSVSKADAGFKVVIMLPPYKRSRNRVNFRPASNFRLTYRNIADRYAVREYFTDPEENERSGWFDRDLLPWGPDTMAPDFIYQDKSDNDKKSVVSPDERKEDAR